jgi:hypothetical protein
VLSHFYNRNTRDKISAHARELRLLFAVSSLWAFVDIGCAQKNRIFHLSWLFSFCLWWAKFEGRKSFPLIFGCAWAVAKAKKKQENSPKKKTFGCHVKIGEQWQVRTTWTPECVASNLSSLSFRSCLGWVQVMFHPHFGHFSSSIEQSFPGKWLDRAERSLIRCHYQATLSSNRWLKSRSVISQEPWIIKLRLRLSTARKLA